ncbi:MAG: sigma-54-dependent transcriptional regulator [Rubripirellula sp.]|jgi:two-component system response regulator AtoC
MSTGVSLLIVDDEPNIRSGLEKGLERLVDRVDTAADAEEALDRFCHHDYPIVIADVRLPGECDGLQLVTKMLEQRPTTTAIMITAHGTVETAVDAMRLGAYDFITKPVDLNLIRQQVQKAIAHHQLCQENRELKDRLANAGEISGIIGNCAAMRDVFREIRQVAETDATVWIQGESGTGKELIARALHDLSDRQDGPFVAVNVGALPESLLESELFGHEKGSFTGATRQKPGCFERARGGTLFLDEITEIPAKSQVDLLRVLESGQYCRVGGEEVLSSDARIISATNKEVKSLVADGTFREDLFYRLNIIPLSVPALRQRRDDLPLLVEHFLNHFCERHRREGKRFSAEAMKLLGNASWPGNVRQLRNVVERLVVTSREELIDVDDLPADLIPISGQSVTEVKRLADAVEETERLTIQSALHEANFHREQTAKLLGVSLRTLHYKMSRYGLH